MSQSGTLGYPPYRHPTMRSSDIVRMRDNTAWFALKPETDAKGARRARYVNLGAGTLWQITCTIQPALGDTPDDSSVAALYHSAGVQYLDGEEARTLIDCLDAIAAR